jgi:uncharacterized protein YukE
MLDKIIREEYKEIRTSLRKIIDSEFEKEKQKILDRYMSKYKKLVNAVDKVNELYREVKQELDANGIKIDNLGTSKVKIEFERYYSYSDKIKNKELLALELRKEDAERTVAEAETKIRKVIWGENLEYEDMKAAVDNILNNLRDTAKEYNDREKS